MAQQLLQAEVRVPRPLQLWRALVNWLAFLFEIVVQIASFTPSMAQILSYVGLQQSLLSSSSPSFKPLPIVELTEPPPPPPSAAPAHVTVDSSTDGGGDLGIEKLTIVLDLDETLVCAYETSSLPAAIRTRAIEAGLIWFELECVSSEKECQGKPKISYVTVFERPGLRKFLKQIGEFADVVLFTAGLEDYARPLVDKIDVENQICLRYYRPSTVSTEYREHVKDLSCLSKDFCRVVIVDNNPFSFLLQPLNGIPCVPFSAEHPQDEQLLEVILPLLKHLSHQKDVRPVLYENFHMPEWFQMHGIPASSLMV
ncbi:haloacid dehalogenase-like hydrolase (HAD) superfamily protein [Actinidia rufa]|uniref:Haloacid dehalogenase-like hydrolase (HAD) superfamily protein n=1 Tax=Actinidia rufa TaxID=165716 RepID=A0A7J0FVF3_9ERIC|nr:haloacid dehalogenase-like hydrolase (HAD) superfamily protein [Actinidia rufa]